MSLPETKSLPWGGGCSLVIAVVLHFTKSRSDLDRDQRFLRSGDIAREIVRFSLVSGDLSAIARGLVAIVAIIRLRPGHRDFP
ncbi:hypothetical protein TIFTF001_003001 [Ficus carica]|uniref:Uncharacterized protein n=1 Tax=Ficus carica TaxID=3494 RepID=A0AA88CV09_FICCA|nr:hypothetical protein TIFTF001_003001 [Ficus carica]